MAVDSPYSGEPNMRKVVNGFIAAYFLVNFSFAASEYMIPFECDVKIPPGASQALSRAYFTLTERGIYYGTEKEGRMILSDNYRYEDAFWVAAYDMNDNALLVVYDNKSGETSFRIYNSYKDLENGVEDVPIVYGYCVRTE